MIVVVVVWCFKVGVEEVRKSGRESQITEWQLEYFMN